MERRSNWFTFLCNRELQRLSICSGILAWGRQEEQKKTVDGWTGQRIAIRFNDGGGGEEEERHEWKS